ncbi:uncharacterized protein LOC134969376 isoform X2 [Pseudophryne corroboree]|uniref:uncharacterized protein LOC134969376 isoform X2 n=1 Tax=Pseudophryne corroboree TaxID=495146 RepID=UPI0030819054
MKDLGTLTARISSMSVSARRGLWLRQWSAEAESRRSVENLPYTVSQRRAGHSSRTNVAQEDAGATVTSRPHLSPQMRTGQPTSSRKHVALKRPRPDLPMPTSASPPHRRISTVSSRPPSDLLAPSPTRDPEYPHLADDDSMPTDQHTLQTDATFVLDLRPLQTTPPSTVPVATPPQQTSPQPIMSPSTPLAQTEEQTFWSSWANHQRLNSECLQRQNQLLASLPHYMPRISRNLSREHLETRRVATCLEQMRAENSTMMTTLQRIMDDQMRLHQNYQHLLERNKSLTESLGRIIDNNTASNNQLNATLSNLSHNISILHSQQVSTSSGTTTPINTPVTSPIRRSSRSRAHVPGPASEASKATRKK